MKVDGRLDMKLLPKHDLNQLKFEQPEYCVGDHELIQIGDIQMERV